MDTSSVDQLGYARSSVCLYTIGHGARSAAEFLDVLRSFGVECIADVRAYPVSRRHPHYSRQALASYLDEAGMGYRWLGEALGGFRRGASVSVHTALASASLRAYAEHMSSAAFRAGIGELLALACVKPTAMLCAERQPQQCHRAMISDHLTVNGITVIHLLDSVQSLPHRFNPTARWAQERLLYDRGGRGQLEWEF